MVELKEVFETYEMVSHENLDVRTITMGISLLDCIDPDLDRLCEKIYDKITTLAKDLVRVGDEIGLEYGVPVINKRVSVTPIAIVGGAACDSPEDFVRIAQTLDRAAHTIGVNFIGGYSALVQKGMTRADRNLIESIPAALACTERVCSSISLGSTKTGINMDAVRLMGDIVVRTAEATKDADSIGCAKLVVFCNPPDDTPFMAGAFHGVTETDCVINVGVSGPARSSARRSRRRPSRSQGSDSCSPRRPPGGSGCRSASWTSPWPQPLRSGTVSPTSSTRWGWSTPGPPEPQLRWPS